MRWKGNRSSNNVDDLRGGSSGGGGGGMNGGLLKLLPTVYRLLGAKGSAVAVVALLGFTYLTGGDMSMLTGGQPTSQGTSKPVKQSADEKQLTEFVSVVLADTEDTWHMLFKQLGKTYQEPRLVLFRGSVKSACGAGKSEMGPFYCPGDNKVYIDLSFYQDLKNRHQAPGDFAQAYVIAHEVGHHVQTLLGISQKVSKAKRGVSEEEGNQLSVRQELQADCFSGVWAHHANKMRNLLESGDVDEGLTAASAIGDDRLQKQARGYVTPESFTHGSSEQRVRWFKTGLKEGSIQSCDTFKTASL